MIPFLPVDIAAAKVRGAVASGSHNEAAALLDDYCRAVEAQARTLCPGDPAAIRLRDEALELIEWVRVTTLAMRAHCSQQLAALPDFRRYGSPGDRPIAWSVLV